MITCALARLFFLHCKLNFSVARTSLLTARHDLYFWSWTCCNQLLYCMNKSPYDASWLMSIWRYILPSVDLSHLVFPSQKTVFRPNMNQKSGSSHSKSRWCFQICFIFTPKIGEDESNLTHIFSDGLVQPPTRNRRCSQKGPLTFWVDRRVLKVTLFWPRELRLMVGRNPKANHLGWC